MTFPLLALSVLGISAIALAVAHYTRRGFAPAIAASTAILLLHGPLYVRYTSDDAYISFRYARNFADGLGLVWNPGQHVEGYSNFLWVLILAGFDKGGADMLLTARWLGFALAVLAMAGTYMLARDLLEGAAGRIAGVLALLLLAASGPWSTWATAGLEVPLFAALVVGAVLLHLGERDAHRPPLSAVLWGLAAMSRPDGALLVAVSGAFKIGEFAAMDDKDSRAVSRRFAMLLVWGATFAVTYLPYFAWRYDTYGWLFPNTYYAKVGSGLDQYARGVSYLLVFAQESAVWLIGLVPLVLVARAGRRGPLLYLAAMSVAWSADTAYVGGDALKEFRLFAPLLPVMYATVAVAVVSVAAPLFAPAEDAARRRWLPVAAGGAALVLIAFILQSSSNRAFEIALERQASDQRVEMGQWLHAHVPASTVIAVIPAGAIPYESGLPTIDMLGLNDEVIAHRDLPLGYYGPGHEKYNSEYVLSRRPDIIVLYDHLSPVPWAREDYDALKTQILIPGLVDMVNQPTLWTTYEARTAQLGPGRWFNLLVRKDATAVLAATEAPTK